MKLLVARADYPRLLSAIKGLEEAERVSTFRELCLKDLYFLLVYGLHRQDANNDWCFERCREVQGAPDGYLDLWAREHYKSTIITYCLTIQDILKNPEITVGIFSHTRPIAKAFLGQIKREFETNELLKSVFPDVLWQEPKAEAPQWSLDGGIVVKRQGNPKEATVEAWGLVDGQPTSKHYQLMNYDDTVTRESVYTPEAIEKVTAAWELSRALTAEGGVTRYIGTRYHFHDTYATMMERGIKARVHPATEDGTVEGQPVHMGRERLTEKRREMGPYTFGCQMLQDPKADSTQGFRVEWLKYYKQDPKSLRDGMNVYLIADAASEKKKTSDYTAFTVIGAGADQNLYLLDMVRDRLNLTERATRYINLHRHWRPMKAGYEKYGMMGDIEYLKEMMGRENYRFNVIELGGSQPKNDRIRRLIPFFEQSRFYLPQRLDRTNYEGLSVNLIDQFIKHEYEAFPLSQHDDMLDSMSRIFDMEKGGISFPDPAGEEDWDEEYETNAGWAA